MVMQGKKDYLELMKQIPAEQIALILESRLYTFGMLVSRAENLRLCKGLESSDGHYIYIIQSLDIEEQLINFLACSGTQAVPVIVPCDVQVSQQLLETKVPKEACMAVMTSGTTGQNKLLFRTLKSWEGYFYIQNKIFGMGDKSSIFMHGSLAFTGNLNLYLAQLITGGTVIAEKTFDPRRWREEIEAYRADVIYLIPTKLCSLKKAYHKKKYYNNSVKSIICGSQSLGGREAEELKQVFRNSSVTLYYGASELNYITYVKDSQMGEDKTLIGKPFPEVRVWVERGEICVNTIYGVIGTKAKERIGDCGHFDQDGMLYFDGREDGICNVNGRKVLTVKIENELESIPGIAQAAVKVVKKRGHDMLAAWVVAEEQGKPDMSQVRQHLQTKLPSWEVPKAVYFMKELPQNESGKILKRKLQRVE
jgi:long-chain acyl-CoA synthetase